MWNVDKRVADTVTGKSVWSLVNTSQPERFIDEHRTHYKALYKCSAYFCTCAHVTSNTSYKSSSNEKKQHEKIHVSPDRVLRRFLIQTTTTTLTMMISSTTETAISSCSSRDRPSCESPVCSPDVNSTKRRYTVITGELLDGVAVCLREDIR